MRLAVMQPYSFPYLGYYQLVNAVDTFVLFDDVNFINKGWINRNNILVQGKAHLFTIPLNKASQNKLIREIELADYSKWKTDFLKLLAFNYKKAPFFGTFYPWLEEFFSAKEYRTISDLASDSVRSIAALLGLQTRFLFSSELDYDAASCAGGEDKVLNICRLLGARTYINPKNAEGLGLYNKERFDSESLDLRFINMNSIAYPQMQKGEFVPYLSMLDVLMFNDPEQTRQLLNEYTL